MSPALKHAVMSAREVGPESAQLDGYEGSKRRAAQSKEPHT